MFFILLGYSKEKHGLLFYKYHPNDHQRYKGTKHTKPTLREVENSTDTQNRPRLGWVATDIHRANKKLGITPKGKL